MRQLFLGLTLLSTLPTLFAFRPAASLSVNINLANPDTSWNSHHGLVPPIRTVKSQLRMSDAVAGGGDKKGIFHKVGYFKLLYFSF
jgi:hypothetical protein